MKKNIVFSVLTGVFLMTGIMFHYDVKAQEWSASQKEVLKVVNDYWAVMTKGDLPGFFEYIHPDYLGWEDNEPLPSTKPEVQKWLQFSTPGTKVLVYDIKPVGIRVFGDFAFVDYYYSMVTDMGGKKKPEEGRWTDILMKQGNKWLLIGDNGGAAEKEHED